MRQNMAVNDNNGCLCFVFVDLFIRIFSKLTEHHSQRLLTTILISDTIIGFTKEVYGGKNKNKMM